MANDNASVITIQMTQGYETVIDEIDVDLAEIRWQPHIGQTGRVYARRKIIINGKGHHIWLHRVIYGRASGLLIITSLVDHIDNNPLNNTRDNLREATHSQNLRNASRVKKDGLKGATYHKRDKRWRSSIRVDGVFISLGGFPTELEAHEAYCKAAEYYFGEFARTE